MNTHVSYLLDRVMEIETKVVALEEENEVYEEILKEMEEKGLVSKCAVGVVDEIETCMKDLTPHACCDPHFLVPCNTVSDKPCSSKKKCYISGKISGLDIEEVRIKFNAAKTRLDTRVFEPVSPFDNGLPAGLKWEDYMMADLAMLKECDAILMLKDWKDSVGAKIERKFAKKMGLEIYYER